MLLLCILFWCLFYRFDSLSLWNVPTQHITQTQWKSIKNMLRNPHIPDVMKQTIRKKIFDRYRHWSSFCAWKFKKRHSYKCRHIHLDELANYAHSGLWKAIQQYNGNSTFWIYANIYIQGELYQGLTLLYPICKVSKKERKRQKHTIEKNITTYLSRKEYKKKLNTQFVGVNEWIFDQSPAIIDDNKVFQKWNEKELIYESWKPIHSLPPFQKRVFQLKYNAEWEKIRSNREVAMLMACSEEYVRKILTQWHQI